MNSKITCLSGCPELSRPKKNMRLGYPRMSCQSMPQMIDCFYKNKTSQSFLASASSCDKMTQFFTGKMPAAAAATGALESHTLIQKLKTVFSLLFLAPSPQSLVPSPPSPFPSLPFLHSYPNCQSSTSPCICLSFLQAKCRLLLLLAC